jgi:hypothetical protein
MVLNIGTSGFCGGASSWPIFGGRWLLCGALAHRHSFLRDNLPPGRAYFTDSSHDVFGNTPTPTFHCSGEQSTDLFGWRLPPLSFAVKMIDFKGRYFEQDIILRCVRR